MVFQIVDDILDITDTTEQLGKPAGHDLVEGVYTLPVLRTLAMDGPGEELALCSAGRWRSAERDKALAIVRANEGVESAAVTARQYVAAAEEACDDLPPGVASDALPRRPAALLESAIDPAGGVASSSLDIGPRARPKRRMSTIARPDVPDQRRVSCSAPGGRGPRRPCRRLRRGRSRRGAGGWP